MLQIKKDYIMQIGVVEGDILFQYTTVCFATEMSRSSNYGMAVLTVL